MKNVPEWKNANQDPSLVVPQSEERERPEGGWLNRTAPGVRRDSAAQSPRLSTLTLAVRDDASYT